MVHTVVTCDRCGADCTGNVFELDLVVKRKEDRPYSNVSDLCKDCFNELTLWFDNKKEE